MARTGELTYADDAIGIVYPIYGHMMPDMVRRFIGRATFDTPYLYFICTYGNRHANATELCVESARAAGLEPAYVSTLLMVDNWLPNFDMDEQRACIPEKRIDENLARIKADVAARKRWIEPVSDEDRAAHQQFLSLGLTFDPENLDDFLTIDAEKCVGCGICARCARRAASRWRTVRRSAARRPARAAMRAWRASTPARPMRSAAWRAIRTPTPASTTSM